MSNKEIHRYKIDTIDELGLMSFCRVDMPKGAKVVNVSTTWPHDGGKVQVHAIVNPKHKEKERWFAVVVEGQTIENYENKTFEYLGMVSGPRIYHIFEVHD